MKSIIYSLMISMFCSLSLNAQLFSDELGNNLYNSGDFELAIPHLEKQATKPKSPDANKFQYMLANSYYELKQYDKAIAEFSKVKEDEKIPKDYKLKLAQCYIRKGNYNAAKTIVANMPDGQHIIEVCDYSVNTKNQVSNDYKLSNDTLGLKGYYFGGGVFDNNFYFSEPQPKMESMDKTIASNYTISKVKLTENGNLEKARSMTEISTRFNIGSPIIYANGSKIIYCENDSKEKISKEKLFEDRNISSEGDVTLNLYLADLKGNEIQNPAGVSFNSREYSTMHPFLTADGKRLYFSSNMPGGQGGYDLYYCDFSDGIVGQPINLGTTINSSEDEMYPSMFRDSILYYSSNGKPGFGGADIFTAVGNGTSWKNDMNAGNVLNSSSDDFGVTFTKNRLGYFASDRVSKPGTDILYSFLYPLKEYLGEGIVYDKLTLKPIPFSTVKVMKNGIVVDELTTDKNGYWKYDKFNNEDDFVLEGSKEGYNPHSEKVGKLKEGVNKIDIPIYLYPEAKEDLVMEFKDILFELNKADLLPESKVILDRVAEYLKTYNVNIELSAHTDSRASFKYNESLSDRRAKSSVEYLISKGIDAGRMVSKGYGEYRLKNECKDGVKCTEELHQENRRVEIRIMSTNK